jgi:hypothetical protein
MAPPMPPKPAALSLPGVAQRKINLTPLPPAPVLARPKAPPLMPGLPGMSGGLHAPQPAVIRMEIPGEAADKELEIIIMVKEGGRLVAESTQKHTLGHASSRFTVEVKRV